MKNTINLGLFLLSITLTLASYAGMVHYEKKNPPTTAKTLKSLHGHLGPYVVLGGKMGDHAIKKLGIQGYSDVRVIVECQASPPHSCVIDGLQASTGATFGKQNIFLLNSSEFQVKVINTKTNQGLKFSLTKEIHTKLQDWKVKGIGITKQSEKIMNTPNNKLFLVQEYSD